MKVRSSVYENYVIEWETDLHTGDVCPRGTQLRPHIVWFGEAVPKIEEAALQIMDSDFVLIIGTSMQVYPAASLTSWAPPKAQILYVDPRPQINYELSRQGDRLKIFEGPASTKVKEAVDYILTASY